MLKQGRPPLKINNPTNNSNGRQSKRNPLSLSLSSPISLSKPLDWLRKSALCFYSPIFMSLFFLSSTLFIHLLNLTLCYKFIVSKIPFLYIVIWNFELSDIVLIDRWMNLLIWWKLRKLRMSNKLGLKSLINLLM